MGSLLGANKIMLVDEKESDNPTTLFVYSIQENEHCTEIDRLVFAWKDTKAKTKNLKEKYAKKSRKMLKIKTLIKIRIIK